MPNLTLRDQTTESLLARSHAPASLVPTLPRGNAYGNGRTRFPRRSMGTSGSRWESLVPALLRPSFPRALRGNAYGTAYGA